MRRQCPSRTPPHRRVGQRAGKGIRGQVTPEPGHFGHDRAQEPGRPNRHGHQRRQQPHLLAGSHAAREPLRERDQPLGGPVAGRRPGRPPRALGNGLKDQVAPKPADAAQQERAHTQAQVLARWSLRAEE